MRPITFLRLLVAEMRPWQALLVAGCLSALVSMIATAIYALSVPL